MRNTAPLGAVFFTYYTYYFLPITYYIKESTL